METKMENTMNTIKVVYTYNGKTLELSDLLRDHISQKVLDIYSWKAREFFAATPREDKQTVNA